MQESKKLLQVSNIDKEINERNKCLRSEIWVAE